MENLDKLRFADAVRTWALELKNSRRLQQGWGLSSIWLLAGMLLLSCRVMGSFTPGSDTLRALGIILLANGLALTVSWGLSNSSKKRTGRLWDYPAWNSFLFVGSITLTLAILPAGSSVAVLTGIGTLLLLGFFLSDLTLSNLSSTSCSEQEEKISTTEDRVTDQADDNEIQLNTSPQEQLIQWLSRKQDAQGTEIVEGMVRLELAAGQIQKAAHVAFTPSFAHVPEMECEPLGDAEVEVTIGDVYPHGFRVEIRRIDSNRDAMEVEVGFQAICDNVNQNAA